MMQRWFKNDMLNTTIMIIDLLYGVVLLIASFFTVTAVMVVSGWAAIMTAFFLFMECIYIPDGEHWISTIKLLQYYPVSRKTIYKFHLKKIVQMTAIQLGVTCIPFLLTLFFTWEWDKVMAAIIVTVVFSFVGPFLLVLLSDMIL